MAQVCVALIKAFTYIAHLYITTCEYKVEFLMYVLRTFHNMVPPPPTSTPVVDKIHMVLFSLNLFISELFS